MATKKQLIDRWKTEPGTSIQQRVYDWVLAQAQRGWVRPDDRELFGMLEGLPFRDEVPGGGDLRGSTFAGARNLDLRGADLSYCVHLGSFDNCELKGANLTGAKFSFSLKGTFIETSFKGARLSGTYGGGSTYARCDFAGANLKNIHWSGSDLRGSSFVDANLEGADLQRCDLRGCDLRRATLDFAMFRQVTLDATTDLRGASLRGRSSRRSRSRRRMWACPRPRRPTPTRSRRRRTRRARATWRCSRPTPSPRIRRSCSLGLARCASPPRGRRSQATAARS